MKRFVLSLAALALSTALAVAQQPGPPRPPGNGQNRFVQMEQKALAEAFVGITKAIRVGAPVYNQGNHEACFRIYEGAATQLEQSSSCLGVRRALGNGLLKAGEKTDYTAKAWAMRDAFDGLLKVMNDKAQLGDDAPAATP